VGEEIVAPVDGGGDGIVPTKPVEPLCGLVSAEAGVTRTKQNNAAKHRLIGVNRPIFIMLIVILLPYNGFGQVISLLLGRRSPAERLYIFSY